MPDNRHEINFRVDSSLYQLESILESLQGLVQGGLASFLNDIGKVDPRRVERLKYLLGQLNQSQASKNISDSLQNVVNQVETIASALQVGVNIKAPVLEPIFPKLLENFNESIQKRYDEINRYISEIFSADYIEDTLRYIPNIIRSTRADVAAQLSKRTQDEIRSYIGEFGKNLNKDVRTRYADYLTLFKPTRREDGVDKEVIYNTLEQLILGKQEIPHIEFKSSEEAVTNYTISKNQIGIGEKFAHLTPRAKNFLTQHELGHSLFTRFQNLFPQRFDQIIHSGIIGDWQGKDFQGIFGHEKTSPHETLADLYAYFMTNPRGMEKALPKQFDFIDQFLSREIFQPDVLNFAYSKLTPEKVEEIRKLYNTGQYTKTALSKQFGVSRRQINRVLNYENWAPPAIESIGKPSSLSYVYLGKVDPKPIITPPPIISSPEPPKPIIIPEQPTKKIILPTREEVKRYSYSPVPPSPKEQPPKSTEFPNRALEMMNSWLEKEYQASAQLLKETRDGKKDSQKQAFDLKHLLAISAEARVNAIKNAQENLEDIFVATGRDRQLTESFIRENIAFDTEAITEKNIRALLGNQGLRPHQVTQLTEKYMKLIQDSLPPTPPPPPTEGGTGDWSWKDAARSIGKFTLNSLVGGAFNAMDIIVDKAGMSLSDIISRGMTINENLYYPMEMTMAGRMGRLMRAGMGKGFTEDFAKAIQQMWGQAIPLEMAGSLMSNYTALLGSTSMENLVDQLIPLTNIARTTGIEPEQFIQPVAGMLRMMPGRTSPQVYTQLSESIAQSLSNADLTKAIGTDEILKVFSTLSKNYFTGASEISPEAVRSALSMVGYLTNLGAPGLQGAVGLENLARLNQSLQGKGTALTPLLYLGANFQAPEWGATTLEKMVNISSRFAREGLFMRNEGTNEYFLFSLLRRIMQLSGGNQAVATTILSREGNISPDIAQALFNLQGRLQKQLGSNYATPEVLNAIVGSILQGDQKAYEVMMKGTELEQMQYYQLLEANTMYEDLVKNTGQLPLQIAMKGRQQLSPLMEKVYSALAEGAQGNVAGAFKQLVQAFKEVPGVDREGASIMAYSALRNAGMTPQSLMEGLQRALPQTIGTTIGAALGPTLVANISTILPVAIPLIATAVLTHLISKNFYKDYYEKAEDRAEKKETLYQDIIPKLQKEGRTQQEIDQYTGIYETINAYKNTPEKTKKSKAYEQIIKSAVNVTDFNTLVDVWQDVQGTDLEKPYQEILEKAGVFKKVSASTDPNPKITQPLTSLSNQPLVNETLNKPITYTGPQQVNSNNNYTFTINIEAAPGEDIEQIMERATRQIMDQFESSKKEDTRNRNGGQ